MTASLALERALACTLDGETLAGRSRRWESARNRTRTPARVLLSSEIVEGYYWPVRVEAETRFGRVVARLIERRQSAEKNPPPGSR